MQEQSLEKTRQELTFQLGIEEANLILEALGQMSFARVHQLVAKLQQQAAAQLEPTT